MQLTKPIKDKVQILSYSLVAPSRPDPAQEKLHGIADPIG